MPSSAHQDYISANLDLVELLLRAQAPSLSEEHASLEGAILDQRLRLEGLRGAIASPPDAAFTSITLDDATREALWLIVAPWVDTRFRESVARANDNILYHYVDTRLCLRALLTDEMDFSQHLALREALVPGGALEQAGLVTHHARSQEPNPLYHEVVPHDDVVSRLLGHRALSRAVSRSNAVSPVYHAPGKSRVTFEGFTLESDTEHLIERFIQHPIPGKAGRILLVDGNDGSGRATHVRAIAARNGRGVISLDASGLEAMSAPSAFDTLEQAAREAALYQEVLLLRHADRLVEPRSPWAAALRAALARWPAHAFCCVEPQSRQVDSVLIPFVLYRARLEQSPDVERAQRLIDHHASEDFDAEWTPSVLQRCATMTPLQIERTLEVGRMLAGADEGQTTSQRLLEISIHSQSTADLGHLARASQPKLTFNDLVLAKDTMAKVRQIVSAVQNRMTVLHTWKIAKRIRRGLGIVCLFDGEPGTGKTLSAEVIAGTLSLQLLRVNVANIVDKYIGETEKHLARIFERAQPESSILLFDEADALFSKRTEVKSSNDHYANMSINVLLQLIEAYTGVCILTTNLKKGIDNAFERRIMFKINYPLPKPPERRKLWKSLLPDDVPRAEELDFGALAEVEMSGGSIKNAILRAAYAAAQDGSLLTLDHLLDAAYAEAAASGRLVRQPDEHEIF